MARPAPSRPAIEPIGSCTAREHIVAESAAEGVVARAAEKPVLVEVAREPIAAVLAEERVAAVAAEECIVAFAALDLVIDVAFAVVVVITTTGTADISVEDGERLCFPFQPRVESSIERPGGHTGCYTGSGKKPLPMAVLSRGIEGQRGLFPPQTGRADIMRRCAARLPGLVRGCAGTSNPTKRFMKLEAVVQETEEGGYRAQVPAPVAPHGENRSRSW